MSSKTRDDEISHGSVIGSSLVDQISGATSLSLQFIEYLDQFSFSDETWVLEFLGNSAESVHKVFEEASSIAHNRASDHQRKIQELLVERHQFQVIKSVAVDDLTKDLGKMDLIEDTLKLNAEKMDECERESNNNSEHLEIAEKQAKEFRTKAAVGFGLTSALTYVLGLTAVVLTDGLAIPIIAAIAAGTQIAGTGTALKRAGQQLQENVEECQVRRNRSEQKMELITSQLQETLTDRELNFESLETTALQLEVSEEFGDEVVEACQLTAKSDKLLQEILDLLGHLSNVTFHLKELFKNPNPLRQSRQKCFQQASQYLQEMVGFLFRFHNRLENSHGILDSSENSFGKISILESSLNEMNSRVSQLNMQLALLSEERNIEIEFSI